MFVYANDYIPRASACIHFITKDTYCLIIVSVKYSRTLEKNLKGFLSVLVYFLKMYLLFLVILVFKPEGCLFLSL